MNDLIEVVGEYNKRIFYQMQDYSQFTIDVFDELEEVVSDDENELLEGDGLGSLNEFIGSSCYQVSTIIDVLKEGKDKEIFQDLLNALEQFQEKEKKNVELKTINNILKN